jgi:NAD(P)-dependent dehydrogenase (short-subunit alcohol dehydrogenase family)
MTDNQPSVLAGRRAVVTGGSKGIGLSIALALAGAGADVAVSARGQDELDHVAGQIRALGRRSLALSCDVTDPAQVDQLATGVLDEWGGIDILINNAGAAGSHKFIDHPDELWHRLLAINLTGTYYVTKAFVPAMVEQNWGRIINIASIASKIGGRYIAAYTASKHGVLGLTRALALELVSSQITVNAICPGYVDTPMTDSGIANIVSRTKLTEAEARTALEKTSPQNRLIEPEEVAAVAVLLAQDISKGITGQAINVDGGTVMA